MLKEQHSHSSMPPKQAYVALGVVALASLVLGVWQIRTSIRLPFALEPASSVGLTAEQQVSTDQPTGVDIQALKAKDTDGDGLSDYDETYLHRTSPYLKDTDSDGFDDPTEIASSNDPLCPQGQTCTDAVAAVGVAGEPTVAQIRELLKKNGATDEQLAQYDDATLVQLYREVAGEQSAVGATSPGTTAPTDPTAPAATPITLTPEQKAMVQNLSGAQLREFLVKGGAEAAFLSKFDDAALQVIVKQTLGL